MFMYSCMISVPPVISNSVLKNMQKLRLLLTYLVYLLLKALDKKIDIVFSTSKVTTENCDVAVTLFPIFITLLNFSILARVVLLYTE